MPLKVLSVFGTRPEAIKLAPVIQEISAMPRDFESVVCITGQHREMLDGVLECFNLEADFDLNLMRPKQTLYGITAEAMSALESVLRRTQPDVVLVQGDTTTAMVGSLAAFYARIPVAHVEAGLRTNDKLSPFPEEINRRITAQIADLHFAPTTRSRSNLLREGVRSSRIFVTGNTVIDALLRVVEQQRQATSRRSMLAGFAGRGIMLDDGRRRILVTCHRRESFGSVFGDICEALKRIALLYPEIEIIYPVHLNPNIQMPVTRALRGIDNVRLTEPLSYKEFVFLMCHCDLILTDSGGVQEEAPSLGKPVLVLREKTERPEAVEAGVVRVAGVTQDGIVSETRRLLDDEDAYMRMSRALNPYGDGRASERIARALREYFATSDSPCSQFNGTVENIGSAANSTPGFYPFPTHVTSP